MGDGFHFRAGLCHGHAGLQAAKDEQIMDCPLALVLAGKGEGRPQFGGQREIEVGGHYSNDGVAPAAQRSCFPTTSGAEAMRLCQKSWLRTTTPLRARSASSSKKVLPSAGFIPSSAKKRGE